MLFRRANIWDAPLFAKKSCSRSRHPQKIGVLFSIFDQQIGNIAFKVLLVEGSGREPVASLIFKNCVPVRDILKILRFSDFINILKLCSRARQFDLFNVLIIFVSSKIALPLGTSSKFRRFIFIKSHQNDAPVRGIRKILFIYLKKLRPRAEHPRNFVDASSNPIKMTLPCGAFAKF